MLFALLRLTFRRKQSAPEDRYDGASRDCEARRRDPDDSTSWGEYCEQFFDYAVPSRYSINNLPEPSDPRVKLIELEPMTAAVLQFSGSTSDAAVTSRITELMTAIQNTKWRVSGAATAFFYNPPWTLPFLRRKEVAVPVSK
jgi:hypothetical protein